MTVRRLVTQRLEGRAVAADLGSQRVGLALRSLLAEVRELADAGELALARRHLAVPVDDRGLDERREVLSAVQPGEKVPRRGGQVAGQLLDGVRATRRVGDAGEVRLGDQEGAGVAGDAATEGVRSAERAVERQDRDRVRSSDAGREGRDRGAEHVHPRVVGAHHRSARDDVLALLDAGRRR